MGWLIQMLLEAVREQCSQFIIDMMEIVNQVFTELLSCDLDLFEELFSVVKDLYREAIVGDCYFIAYFYLAAFNGHVWKILKFGRSDGTCNTELYLPFYGDRSETDRELRP